MGDSGWIEDVGKRGIGVEGVLGEWEVDVKDGVVNGELGGVFGEYRDE